MRFMLSFIGPVVAWAALTGAIVLHRGGVWPEGRFWLVSLAILVSAGGCVAAGWRAPNAGAPRSAWDLPLLGLGLLAAVVLGSQLFIYVDIGDRTAVLQRAARAVIGLAAVASCVFLPYLHARFARWPWARVSTRQWVWALIGMAVALKLFGIAAYPRPGIDVWHVLQGGVAALNQGQNPYATHLADAFAAGRGFGNPPSSYVYTPTLLFSSWPVVTFLSDVRYLHVIADLLVVFFLFGMTDSRSDARLRRYAEMLALVWVFHPVALAKEWTDQLVAPFLFGAAYVSWRWPRSTGHALAIGLLLSVKQYVVLLAPAALVALWPDRARRWRLLAIAGLAAVATAIPFLLWDLPALWRSLVLFHFMTPFRADSITLSAWLVRAGGAPLPGWVGFVLATGLAILTALWGRHRGLVAFALGGSLELLVLFFASWYAFPNYFHFVMALGLLGIFLLLAEQPVEAPGEVVADQLPAEL